MDPAQSPESGQHYVSPRLIGRRAERATLMRLIEDSRRAGRIALVEGEAGIGKSRLLNDVAQAAGDVGYRVLIGGCVSLNEDVAPLSPIAEALRGLAAETPASELATLLGPARDVLGGLLPGVIDPTNYESRTGLMHSSSQQRLHAHLVDLISRMARDKPLVLVIEDIHWADAATLELLALLARNLRAMPFAMIVSYRSDEADPSPGPRTFLAELKRLAHPTHIRLPRFNRVEVLEQVAAIRGPASSQPDRVDELLARSEGNPFYIEELLAVPTGSGAVLPSSLEEVLRARLAALSEPARRLVAAGAVRHGGSTEDQLAQVTGLDDGSVASALHELLDRKILERRRAGGHEVLAFRHALIKSAAYEDLLMSERRRLHFAYAKLLDQEPWRDDPFVAAELAAHWEASGDVERALPAALFAGAIADAAYQPALASEQYERAVRLLDRVPPDAALPSDRVDILERAARAAAAIGSPRSLEHIGTALASVDAAQEPARAGVLKERQGRYRWFQADGEGALAAYQEAVDLVPQTPLSAARGRVTAGLAQLLMILARFEESVPYCEEALVNARAVADLGIEAHATNTMGVNVAYMGDPDRAVELLWAANAIAAENANVEEVGRTLANLVDVLLTAGRYGEAADLGRSSFGYCVEHGLGGIYGASLLSYTAWALHILARWPEALTALDEVRMQPHDANSEIMSLAISAMIEACRGDIDRAESHLEIGRPLIANAIDTQIILPFCEAEAEYALATGRPDLALATVMDGLARSQPLAGGNIKRYGPVHALGLRAAADVVAQSGASAGMRAQALADGQRLISDIEAAHRQIPSQHSVHLRMAEAYLALCAAEWARLQGESDTRTWARAAESLDRLGRPHWSAYAQWRQAEAELTNHGRTPLVERLLTEAHATAVEIGARPLRESIERLARRARVGLVSTSGDAADRHQARFGLTAREIEVLRLVAAGKTNHEIGEELFISGKTASVHVSNVMAKLDVSRRSEAAAVATRLGLAGDPSTPAGNSS